MRTAIFGGTFDPIHSAHLEMARQAADQFGLDRVLFIPAGNPPHKHADTPFEHRYRMVELACAADPRFVASRLEEGDQKSYSIHTIERVKADNGEVFFIIGSDAFRGNRNLAPLARRNPRGGIYRGGAAGASDCQSARRARASLGDRGTAGFVF